MLIPTDDRVKFTSLSLARGGNARENGDANSQVFLNIQGPL